MKAQEKECRIRFYSSVTKTFLYEEIVPAGSYYLLPSEQKKDSTHYMNGLSIKEYNFLGWTKKSSAIKTSSPDYKAGQYLLAENDIRLYDVMFPVEKDEIPFSICGPDKFDKIIFVGDSRTEDMKNALQAEGIELSGVSFICKGGQTIDRFQQSRGDASFAQLKNAVFSCRKADRIAIVLNLGVNDLFISRIGYPAYTPAVDSVVMDCLQLLSRIRETFKGYRLKIYMVSLNPCNYYMDGTFNVPAQRRVGEDAVIRFNEKLKISLSKKVRYIDTWSYMIKKGYFYKQYASYTDKSPKNTDGLHFSLATSLRVLKFILARL
ncbi:MAG: SGNH/GDSL hydrolase family protein [Blautia sp.]|nr:SGNH/GDSL hydrolase family protein [Blautia sp.]